MCLNSIKISSIIYVRNGISYIEKCVRSVMKQSLRAIEILIIDGGSTDGTLDIIEKLKREDNRIHIFHAPASVGAQFNLGLKKAKGEYIGICEADDYILPDMYEKQYKIASENQLDLIRASYYQICDRDGIEYKFDLKSYTTNVETETVIQCCNDTFFLEQGIRGFWNGLYRRQFLLDHQIWMNETKGAAHQDISFSFLTQMYAKRIWFMNKPFYCYRIDNPGASANSLNGVRLHMGEYEELRKRLVDLGEWEKYKNIFYSWELISYQWFLYQLPRAQRENNAREVYRYLQEQNEKEQYNIKYIIKDVRKLAKSIFLGEDDFVCNILLGIERCDELLDYIISSFEKEPQIVLFGMGHVGNVINLFLELCKKEVIFMDNNRDLQKNGIRGKRVYSPEELVKSISNIHYIVANVEHGYDMKKQLIGLGVQKDKILVCDNEEFFLRKIFVRA